MSRRCLFLVALLLVLGFAPAPFPRTRRDDPVKDDLRKLQGVWVCVRYQQEGAENMVPAGADALRFTFAGARMTISVAGEIRSAWDVKPSPDATPRVLTKTRDDRRFVLRCLYRFEGERLILYESNSGEAPASFEAGRGDYWTIVLRRR